MTDWPTTRRYPRTLREAFPHSREHAYPVEATRLGWWVRWQGPILACCIAVALAAALVFWWSNPHA